MELDRFKESFKYYKSRELPPDLSKVIEIDGDKNQDVLKCLSCDLGQLDPFLSPSILKSQWNTYELASHPGLILIRNPFTPLGQRYLISRCLQDYARHPNPTNLTKQNPSYDSWWEELCHITDEKVKKKHRESLRWTTLGYHHDWDTKVYNENVHNEFPSDLKHLIQEMAAVLSYKKYQPEAAIVNFYPLNTTLAGHTDHSEFCNEPLFSISLGQSAIFLIGGETRDIKPVPLLLRSGDVAVFTGKSRLCYHAVPKIIKIEEKEWWSGSIEEEVTVPESFDKETVKKVSSWNTWKACDEYVSLCRININVRQVYSKTSDGNDNKRLKVEI